MSDTAARRAGERRKFERIRRRMPCMLVLGDRTMRAIVTDLSLSGLHVAAHGGVVLSRRVDADVVFAATPDRPNIRVRTAVVRRERVPAHRVALIRPGLGLKICRAAINYERLVKGQPWIHDFHIVTV